MLVDAIVTGLIVGGAYALVAMGLTLQYGVARIMNLAHGEMILAAAFAAFCFQTSGLLNPLVSLIVIVPVAFALSWLIYRYLMRPLVKRAAGREDLEVDSIMSSFGLLFVLQGVMLIIFGGDFYNYSFLASSVDLMGTRVGLNRLVSFGGAAVIASGLYFLLFHTRLGTAIRAVGADPRAAGLAAINVPRILALTFAIGGAVAACGGVLVSTYLTFSATMGVAFTTKALVVVIMGGVGDIRGAVIAGLLLGIAETFVASFIDPNLTLAAVYGLFLLTLVTRPSGLFGRSTR